MVSHNKVLVEMPTTPSDEELLDDLRTLLAVRGKLTASLIEASQLTRYPNAYVRRFGSLSVAYELIGYEASEQQRAASKRFREQAKS